MRGILGRSSLALLSGSGATVLAIPESDPGAPPLEPGPGERVIVTTTADRVAQVEVVA